MSEHHIYEPWPGSATGLPVCKFCGQPPNALIHTVPLEMCNHPYNAVSDAGVCGGCGVHLTIKVSPISAEALATERARWQVQTEDLWAQIEKLKGERDFHRRMSEGDQDRRRAAEAQRCPADCQYRCHHTTSQETFASELSFAWNQVRQARAERDELRGKVQER